MRDDRQVVVETADYTRLLPVYSDFGAVLDDALYRPVPANWLIAVSDVVGSRNAIAEGHYKAVNMAGVAMIGALMNALGTQDLPYIFGGDGAAMICAPSDRESVADTLGKTVAWVRDDLGLTLRAALVPVSVVREKGFDVLVQANRLSDAVKNFAFRGGGISCAEKLMKAGEFAVAAAGPGARPDLTGLSCRWSPIRSEGRSIVSIIIEAGVHGAGSFSRKAVRLLDLAGLGGGRSASPTMASGSLNLTWPPADIELEARATRGSGSLVGRKLGLYAATLFAHVLFVTGIPIGRFDPKRYRRFTSLNTDYRKFQDGLRITVSLAPAELARLRAFLEGERRAGNLRYGLCVQDSAILTCYVPSVTSDTHFHFLDGAGGGYAQAAENMKS